MSYLSVCTVFRDEAEYLAEWLEWHILKGVNHFYLYNHRSKDNYLEVLEPYVKERLVTLIQWPNDPPQFSAYRDAIRSFRHDTEWMAFLDVDEFLDGTLYPVMSTWLLGMKEHVGAVGLHWRLFGSNGYLTKTDGLVTERFTKSARTADKHVKSIVRMKAVKDVGKNPHYFKLREGFVPVNEWAKLLPENYSLSDNPTTACFYIRHYHVKSKEEYMQRKTLPDCGSGLPNTNLEERFRVHDLNEVEDYAALKYVDYIKKTIEARKSARSS